MKGWMPLIGLFTFELLAIECKNKPDPVRNKLGRHKITDKFEFRLDMTIHFGGTCR